MPIIKNNIPNAAICSGKTIGEETVSGDEKRMQRSPPDFTDIYTLAH